MRQNSRRRRVFVIGVAFVFIVLWYWFGYRNQPGPPVSIWLIDLVALGGTLLGGAMLVNQFVLPVEDWPSRNQAFRRMMLYLQGGHGPIVFVRNGKQVARERDVLRRGPGVILVDSASAVALQTIVAFRRTHGPGVVFTAPGEFITDALDLRVQSRRKTDVKAITRDGIELTADISVKFMLERGYAEPGQWQTDDGPPYYFDERSAFLAVYGSAVKDRYDVAWSDLPPLVAADVWRELLLERSLNDLFPGERVEPMPLTALNAELARRLKPPPNDLPESSSREYEVLRNRGIRVLSASVGNIRFPEELVQQRLENWQLQWKRRAIRFDRDLMALRRKGLRRGQAVVLETLTRELSARRAVHEPLRLKDVLRLLIAATLEIADNPGVARQAVWQRRTALQMRSWLNKLDDLGNPMVFTRYDDDEMDAEE